MKSILFSLVGVLCSATSALAVRAEVINNTEAPVRVLYVRPYGFYQNNEQGWYKGTCTLGICTMPGAQ